MVADVVRVALDLDCGVGSPRLLAVLDTVQGYFNSNLIEDSDTVSIVRCAGSTLLRLT